MAALNKVELLPWDVWGMQPDPGKPLDADQLATFDELAWITRDLDVHFIALRERYASDQRLSVPGRVFNALLRRDETV